ncbi:MAG: hypothetical protein ALAOOOJD_04720 [bacterium]|nr:hypothetical protein [bacterium]
MLNKIIIIAADFHRGFAEAGNVQLGKHRRLGRQKTHLDAARNFQLFQKTLALGDAAHIGRNIVLKITRRIFAVNQIDAGGQEGQGQHRGGDAGGTGKTFGQKNEHGKIQKILHRQQGQPHRQEIMPVNKPGPQDRRRQKKKERQITGFEKIGRQARQPKEQARDQKQNFKIERLGAHIRGQKREKDQGNIGAVDDDEAERGNNMILILKNP